MANIKISKLIFLAVGVLYLIDFLLLYDLWSTLPENIAVSWLITGEVTEYSSKQSFIAKFLIINIFLIVFFVGMTLYAMMTKKEYVTLHTRYGGLYKVRTEHLPNYVGTIIIIVLVTINMYISDIIAFNTSRTFFFFNFPFILIYLPAVFAIFLIAIKKYGH
ncbi:MAG: hypothetical protein ACP6IU_12100 [Candidatus Asgardarchaeia archaeon]